MARKTIKRSRRLYINMDKRKRRTRRKKRRTRRKNRTKRLNKNGGGFCGSKPKNDEPEPMYVINEHDVVTPFTSLTEDEIRDFKRRGFRVLTHAEYIEYLRNIIRK